MGSRKNMVGEGNELPIMARYELLDKIKEIDHGNPVRDRALVAFLYLTGARVEEVCRFIIEKRANRIVKKRSKPITKRKEVGLPIKKKQIEFRFEEEVMIVHNVRTLKRKKYLPRSIPVLLSDKEDKIVQILIEYIDSLEDEDFLFPLSRQRAYQILDAVGLFPHYLRHLRNTHLATDYGFDSAHIKKFNGWASSYTADKYVHLNVDDLISKMKRK